MSKAGADDASKTGPRNEWLTTPRFALLLAGFIIAFFSAILFDRQSFVFRDFAFYSYPVALHLRESFWRGEFPLWNPLNDCGTPFMAQWSTGALYPFSFIYIFLPISWALGAFCLIHLFIAGMGMYLLARRWTQNRIGAGIAGLSFAFSGVVLNSLIWPHYMVFLAWTPFVFLTVEQAWREGGRKIVWAIFVGAMHMLSGMPEFIVLTWLMVGCVGLGRCLAQELSWGRSLRRLLAIILGVAALTAVQLLPFLQLLHESQRDADFGGNSWAMPPTGWANFFIPVFHCEKIADGLFMQPTQQLFPSYYLGIFTLILAAVAICRTRHWLVRILTGVMVMSLLFSLGDAGLLYPTLKHIFPTLGLMRYPIKLILPLVFFAPLLAAYGFRDLGQIPPETKKERMLFVSIGWMVSAGVIAFLFWFAGHWHLPNQDDLRSNGLVRLFFTTLSLGLVLLLLRQTERSRIFAISLGLLVSIWLDGVTHLPGFNLSVPTSVYEPGLPNFRDMKPRPSAGQSRAMPLFESAWSVYKSSVDDPAVRVVCGRLALFANCNLYDNIPKVGGFFSLHPRYTETLRRSIDGMGTNPPPVIDFMGVSQTTIPGQIFEWQARTNYMPLITAGQAVVWSDSETNLLAAVLARDFNPREAIYLPEENRRQVSAIHRTDAKVLAQEFSTHRLRATIEASQPSIVAIAQSYYSAWKAYVDEKPVPLWRANYAFQAIEIPAGRHEVKLVYEDQPFKIGLIISSLALIAGVVFLFTSRHWGPERKS